MYLEDEIMIMKYIVSFYDSGEFKFFAMLLRKEFNNLRTEGAYCSRMYQIKKSNDLLSNQKVEYNKLNISYFLLNLALRPVTESKSIEIQTEKVEEEMKSDINMELLMKQKETFNRYRKFKHLVNVEKLNNQKLIEENQKLKYKLNKKIKHQNTQTEFEDIDEKKLEEEIIEMFNTPIEVKEVKVEIDKSLLEYLDNLDNNENTLNKK